MPPQVATMITEIKNKMNQLFFPIVKEGMLNHFGFKSFNLFIEESNTFEDLNNFLDIESEFIRRFKILVQPDKFMSIIYEKLIINQYVTLPELRDYYALIYPEDDFSDSHFDKSFKRRLNFMKSFDMIKHQMVTGVKGTMNLYTVLWITQERYEEITEPFKKCKEYHILYKTVVYKHVSDKLQESDKTIEDITKEAIITETKDVVKKKVKQVTKNLYHCCGIAFKSQLDLAQHWESKQTIFKNSPKCSTCGIDWINTIDSCMHNCEYMYWKKKEKQQAEVKQLLQPKTTTNLLLGGD